MPIYLIALGSFLCAFFGFVTSFVYIMHHYKDVIQKEGFITGVKRAISDAFETVEKKFQEWGIEFDFKQLVFQLANILLSRFGLTFRHTAVVA